MPPPRRIVAKNSAGGYAIASCGKVGKEREEKSDETGPAPSTLTPQQEDADFSLVSNWGHRSGSMLHTRMSEATVGILMGKRYEMATPHSLQERLLLPAIDGKDVVGISPPGRGTSLVVSLLVNQRVDRLVSGVQVLVLKPKPRKDVEIEDHLASICEPNGVQVGGCACATDDECDHPHGHQQVLVHSPTPSCRTTIAERVMESDALRMVVVYRVDELLAADRPKIFAILRAKPPRVQLVITAAQMTPDVLRIARDFMPPRTVNGEPSPVLLSVTKEGLQVVTHSLVSGKLKTKVHVNALRFDRMAGEASARRLFELLRVRTEAPELHPDPSVEQPLTVPVKNGQGKRGLVLTPQQKACLYACLKQQHNLLLYGPPETGKSTVAAVVALKAVDRASAVHALVLVPSVERTQKFHSLLKTLSSAATPSIYVCEEHPKITADMPPPAIVIGKPRQIRHLIDCGLICPIDLKVVVFAQVHKMLGAAYREDPREVLRSLHVGVQVLATSNSGDAAVVRAIDEFFNGDCPLRHDRLHVTLPPVAGTRLGAAFSAAAHRALLDVVERLPEARAAQSKNAGNSASGERPVKKPKKAAKRSGAKDEKNTDRLPGPLEEAEVPVDSEKSPGPERFEATTDEPPPPNEQEQEGTEGGRAAAAGNEGSGSRRSTLVPRNSFLEFNLRPELLQALHRMGLRATLSVQRRAIPALLAGRNAVVRAPAGLGTLGVYLLPLLQRVDPAVEHVQAIVVCQKRSTAAEIEDAMLNGYGQCLRFSTRVCLGGEPVAEQLQAIADGAHVVVGVAQRVRAIVESAQFDAQSLRFVVFDELDELLRTGRKVVHAVLRRLAPTVQLVFVQREESRWVDEAVRKFLADPLRVVGTDEAKAVDRKKEGEQKAPSNARLSAAKEERESKTSGESASSSTSSSSKRTLVEIDSRRTIAQVETAEGPKKPPEKVTVPLISEDEDGESATKAVKPDDVQAAPPGPLATRLAVAQLRGQLLENRLRVLRIYALEGKLGLAHGQPLNVFPPN
ncbi:ATP-dependent RNA helicase eIF4A [Aphelenchoides fujianensis]|nr:ATP-dependent RNA helicase eIF4A [Aphelenchoides fujianensis]